jgi:ABC-type uncharacterized transport system ATPase subunit
MKKVSFKLKEQGPSVVSGLTVSEDLVIHVEAASVAIEFNKHKYSVSEIANIILAQYNVVDMEVQERDIEDIVAQIYARGNVYETTT